ncbi:MAG TPA: Rieske (2Fe-2S) protein [Byssovorax sp.]
MAPTEASAPASAPPVEPVAAEAPETGHPEAPPASADQLARRRVLARVTLTLAGAGAAALGAPVVGFVVAPLFSENPREWRPVGAVEDFEVGRTVKVDFVDASPLPWAGVTSKTAAWLRRVTEGEFVAYSINCAHLGCPVRWLADAHLFMCPCHGGVYHEDGTVAAGPPPHPLSQYPVRVRDGHVEIRTDPLPIG